MTSAVGNPAAGRVASAGPRWVGPAPRSVITAGAVDALGMALGWTVVTFQVLQSGGLATVGAYNSVMFAGTVAAAPATHWAGRWMSVRNLLLASTCTEAALRLVVLGLVFAGAPVIVLAPTVLVSTVMALSGYACMRAQVDQAIERADDRPGSGRPRRVPYGITSYIVTVTVCEALGGALASVLPGGPPGCSGVLPMVVALVYAGSLLPTVRVALSLPRWIARAPSTASPAWVDRRLRKQLAEAALLTTLCSGPTLLYVALTAQYLGARWVAVAAVVNAAGMALAPSTVAFLRRRRVPCRVAWPLLAAGAIGGWVLVPAHPLTVLPAQFAAGWCMAALDGHMDDVVAMQDCHHGVAQSLALTEATRSVGYGLSTLAVPALARICSFQTVAGGALTVVCLYGTARAALARRGLRQIRSR